MAKVKDRQVHGKLDKRDIQLTTIDQVFGDTGMGTFGTLDEAEYTATLKEMNRTDLDRHASKHGIIPVHQRGRLEKDLLTKFKRHVSSYRMPVQPESKIKSEKDLPKKVLKILAEGR